MKFRYVSPHSRLRRSVIDRISRRGLDALVAGSLAMIASGCASVEQPTTKLQAVKSIGIISAIGDDFTITRTGLTAAADADRHASIEAWAVDDVVAARVGAQLGPRYQVQSVSYPRAAFAAREQASPFTVSKLTSVRDSRIADLVRGQVSPRGLDAYVVVTKATSAYGSRGRSVAGIGVLSHVAMFGSSAQLHAIYTVTVVDGHTFKVIDKKAALPDGSTALFRLAGPSRDIGGDMALAAQNPGASDQLKAAVIDLIERSLGKTLQDLTLVDRSAS
jgi:hypothetical protein